MMAADPDNQQLQLRTTNGVLLSKAIAEANRGLRQRAFVLVLPLLLLVALTFVVPIAQMLHRSVYNSGFSIHVDVGTEKSTPIMQHTITWFSNNPRTIEPNETAFEALALDLLQLQDIKAAGQVGTRVNYELSGARSLFTRSARKASSLEAPYKDALIEMDPRWGAAATWSAMRNASNSYTIDFFLAATDLTRSETGEIAPVDPNRRIYLKLFASTFQISLLITLVTLILAYPVASLLARLPMRYSNLLMILVLLPFWTSLLVRTTSWIVILQSQGILNDIFVALGIVADENRLKLIYNQTGTIIAMTHVLLPFMILPLYSVLRSIDPSFERAAASLGANPWTVFWRIRFPLSLPGVGAGSLLVFILSVGYYVTPALVGGADGQLVSNLIAFHMQKSLNWSVASALAALLLFGVLLLYWAYDKIVGVDNLKLG